MIRIGICDDEPLYTDMMSAVLNDFFAQAGRDATFYADTDPKRFRIECIAHPFDAVFLDIDMPDVSGFDISKTLRDTHPETVLIYVSAKQELVFKSFEYHPYYFICKSDRLGLKEKLEAVGRKLLDDLVRHGTLTVQTRMGQLVAVPVGNILYIKSAGHYVQYYLCDGSVLEGRCAISDCVAKLPAACFERIHLQYAVNLAQVVCFMPQKQGVMLKNKITLPVGRSYAEKATNAYLAYVRRSL